PHLFAKAARRKWLQAMGAGVDWAITRELSPRVVVTRAPGIFGPWMAEYVIGWCSWVTQRIETYREAQRQRRWLDHVLPDRLHGKTLTIVGLGDIGRAIARAARAFGMRVVGVSRSGRRVREAERVFKVGELARALADADFVVVLLPLTPETLGLIGADALAAMKPTASPPNIRRGAIAMPEAELARFFDEERVLTCATRGPNARPHLRPLWYVRDGLTLYAWTYGKSQKVRNLEREPRATVQIEAGRERYGELRG